MDTASWKLSLSKVCSTLARFVRATETSLLEEDRGELLRGLGDLAVRVIDSEGDGPAAAAAADDEDAEEAVAVKPSWPFSPDAAGTTTRSLASPGRTPIVQMSTMVSWAAISRERARRRLIGGMVFGAMVGAGTTAKEEEEEGVEDEFVDENEPEEVRGGGGKDWCGTGACCC